MNRIGTQSELLSQSSFSYCLAIALSFFALIFFVSTASAQHSVTSTETMYFDRVLPDGSLEGGTAAVVNDSMSFFSLEEATTTVFEVSTLVNNGTPRNRVDVVFLGDGYTEEEIPQYSQEVSVQIDSLFQITPMFEYRNYFNIHRVDVISNESGVDNDPIVGQMRDNVLGMKFWCQDAAETLCIDPGQAWRYAALAPEVDQIIALANSDTEGASAYSFSDLSLLSGGNYSSRRVLLHLFGHSFANLADEYATGAWATYVGAEPAEANVSVLNAEEMSAQRVKWHRWLDYDPGIAFGGRVGAFEGALGSRYGIHRPTLNSRMQSMTGPFNLPSIEAFILQIYRLVDPIDDATPSSASLNGGDLLFVSPMEPMSHELEIQWSVDGEVVVEATGETFRLNDYGLGNGSHEVSVKVTDTTPFVRDEAARAKWLSSSRTWTVSVDILKPVITKDPLAQQAYAGRSASFSVEASGEGLRYQWYRDGEPISGANGITYNTGILSHSDNGSKFWVVVSNGAGTTTSAAAVLSVLNHQPSLRPINDVVMGWKTTHTIYLFATDEDRDTLSYSAYIDEENDIPEVSLYINQLKLVIDTSKGYVGEFFVKVKVSDGVDTAEQRFKVRTVNYSPYVGYLSDQTMDWSSDTMEVELSATDYDSASLEFSAELGEGAPIGAQVRVSGNTLTIDPPEGYKGRFEVIVSVSDGYNTHSRTFKVDVVNSPPQFYPIEDQRMHWRTDSISVPLHVINRDGDALVYHAKVATEGDVPVEITMDENVVTINPSEFYTGKFSVVATVLDRENHDTESFVVEVYNLPPSLSPIADQRIHWREDYAKLELSASSPDNDPLTFSAFIVDGPSVPVSLELADATLIIDPEEKYLGAFTVRAKVCDPICSDSQDFVVTTYNTPPVLRPIDDQEMAWGQDSIKVELSATDADGDRLTFSASAGSEKTAYLLDQEHNFRLSQASWNDNLRGLGERYIQGVKGIQDTEYWYAILPDGRLFSWKGSLGASELLATLPLGYYQDPSLLFDVPEPVGEVPVQLNVVNGSLEINPEEGYTGVFTVTVEVSDGNERDKDTFSVSIVDRVPTLSPIGEQAVHWKTEKIVVDLEVDDVDGSAEGVEVVFSAELSNTNTAYSLDRKHNFRLSTEAYETNLLRRGGKYFQGTDPVSHKETTYVLFPNGELFEFSQGYLIKQLAVVSPVYYKDPSLLFDVPPPPELSPASISVDGTKLTIDPPYGYVGRFLLTVRALSGSRQDSETFVVRFYNNEPILAEIKEQDVSWTAERHEIALSASDGDNDTLFFKAWLGTYRRFAYELDQVHRFELRHEDYAFNRYGWLEKSFQGTEAGESTDYVILPSGVLYKWQGDFEQSEIIARFSQDYYRDPSLLFSVVPPAEEVPVFVNIERGTIGIDLPEGFLGTFEVTAEVNDGNGYDQETFLVEVKNHAPELSSVGTQWIHVNEDALTLTLSANDVDGEELAFSAELYDSSSAYEVDQTHNFLARRNTDPFNLFGNKAKYFLGTRNEEGRSYWYAILPNGDLYSCTSILSASERIAQLPEVYYRYPTLLVDVPPPSAPLAAEISVFGNELRIDPVEGYVGRFLLAARVDDGNLADEEVFAVTVYNSVPFLSEIPDSTLGWLEDALDIELSAEDPDELDNEALVFTARLGSVEDYVWELFEAHRFELREPDYRYNTQGWRAKFFQGNRDGADTEYAIIPSGVLYQWKGSFQESVVIARLPKTYYEDPSQLFVPAPAAQLPRVELSLDGSRLRVDPPAEYIGSFEILVTVDDGTSHCIRTFTFTVANRTPVLDEVPYQSLHWKNRSIKIPLSARDADNEELTFSTYLRHREWAPKTVEVSVENEVLVVTWKEDYSGSFHVVTTVSDGNTEDIEIIVISVVNHVPVLSPIENQEMGWREDSLTITLPASDKDGDPLTYSAAVKGDNASSMSFSFDGNKLSMDPNDDYFGGFIIEVTVSDGLFSDAKRFILDVRNHRPSLESIPYKVMSWKQGSLEVELIGRDSDGDSLTYFADVNDSQKNNASTEINGNILTVKVRDGFVGFLVIQAKVTDGNSYAYAPVGISVRNLPPVLSPIGPQKMGAGQELLTLKLSASDPDGDEISFSAEFFSGETESVDLSVLGDELSIKTQKDYLGAFVVKVRAWDGNRYADQYFKVTVSNQTPVLSPIEDQTVHWAEKQLSLELVATDADNNPLVFSASIPESSSYPAQVAISGATLNVKFTEIQLGTFPILVSVSDGDASADTSFTVSVVNQTPILQAIPDQRMGSEALSLDVEISAVDPDGDPLSFSAEALSFSEMLYELDIVHDFDFRYNNDFFNHTGNNEKYVQGTKNIENGLFWYVLYPNGDFYEWTGRLSESSLIARLPHRCYEDPSILFDVEKPTAELGADVQVEGELLTIARKSPIAQEVYIQVFASDGASSDQENFILKVDDGVDDDAQCETEMLAICCTHPPGLSEEALTMNVPCASLAEHLAHGDTLGECPREDEEEECHSSEAIESPTYTLWNSFLDMTNILELVNPSSTDLGFTLSFYSVLGELAHQESFFIAAESQLDLILNQLPGFVPNSYGIVKLEFEGTLEGRMVYYRQSADGGSYDFAFAFPLSNPSAGQTAVSFNTFQPSYALHERNNLVANWLTIVNLEAEDKEFEVMTYDQHGSLLMRRRIEVSSFGRVDVDGGHDVAGPSVVGVHVINPIDLRTRYIAQLTRYGGDVPAGYFPSNYRFAFPLIARQGSGEKVYVPISHQFGEDNWVEVINVSNVEAPTSLNFYNEEGRLIDSIQVSLPAFGQKHYNASGLLEEGKNGFVVVIPTIENSVIAQSMYYFKESGGSVTTIYGSQGREGYSCEQSGSYNLFLGMENWLTLANPSDFETEVTLRVRGNAESSLTTVQIPAKASLRLPVHDQERFKTASDTYGMLSVETEKGKPIFSELLRLRFLSNAADFATPTIVR